MNAFKGTRNLKKRTLYNGQWLKFIPKPHLELRKLKINVSMRYEIVGFGDKL
jgi:hypothetical protein